MRPKELIAFGPGIERRLRISPRRVKAVANTYRFWPGPLERDDDGNDGDSQPIYFPFNSVIFLRSTTQYWLRHISRAYGVMCVSNSRDGLSRRETQRPTRAEASFPQTFQERVIWHWPNDTKLTMKLMADIIAKRANKLV